MEKIINDTTGHKYDALNYAVMAHGRCRGGYSYHFVKLPKSLKDAYEQGRWVLPEKNGNGRMEGRRMAITLKIDTKDVIQNRDFLVIMLYYGISLEKKTLKEIGLLIGISSERVRQIKELAIKKMNRRVKSSMFAKHLE